MDYPALQLPEEKRQGLAHWRGGQGRYQLTWKGLETMTIDACLRPITLSWQGNLYLRGLNGRILEILRFEEGPGKYHEARILSPQQREHLLMVWKERLQTVLEQQDDWREHLFKDEKNFQQVYPHPVSILPPDQYRAIVVQLTEGCSWNRCTFCNLYQDRSFKAKAPEEFLTHLQEVKDYFGPALAWRQGIFLGDANAGSLSLKRLLKALECVEKIFGKRAVSCFMDTFSGPIRSAAQWSQLHQAGLTQVNLGIESGDAEVLQLLNKPAEAQRVLRVAENIKAAGIDLTLIFMLGVGGKELAAQHEQATLALLQQMQLTPRDRVYFSELLVEPDRPYAERPLTPLSRAECREQFRRIRGALDWQPIPHGPFVSLYDVRQFTYH